jgi:uncharacterized OB-fold protein
MRSGTVYTETIIYSAAEAFASEVPFQTAIIALDGGPQAEENRSGRLTARIAGERVSIGDRVVEVESRDGVPFFRKA